jgi:hypothetical protein
VALFHWLGRGSLSLLLRPSSFANEDNQEEPALACEFVVAKSNCQEYLSRKILDQTGSRPGMSGSQSDDRLLALTTAVRDFWLLGARALKNALARANSSDQSAPSYLDEVLRSAAAFPSSAVHPSASENSLEPGKAAQMASFMAQLYLIGAAGGLRYWRKLLQTHSAHQAAIVRCLAAAEGDANPKPGGTRCPPRARHRLGQAVTTY